MTPKRVTVTVSEGSHSVRLELIDDDYATVTVDGMTVNTAPASIECLSEAAALIAGARPRPGRA